MPDMLVSLIEIPPLQPLLEELRQQGITIRRPNPWEQTEYRKFVHENWGDNWTDESSVAFTHKPVSLYVAVHEGKFVGFAAWECTRRNFFGPTGVAEAYRGKGIGKALYLAALYALRDLGYVYAIIGGAGPVDFYKNNALAMEIPFHGGSGIFGLSEDLRFTNPG